MGNMPRDLMALSSSRLDWSNVAGVQEGESALGDGATRRGRGLGSAEVAGEDERVEIINVSVERGRVMRNDGECKESAREQLSSARQLGNSGMTVTRDEDEGEGEGGRSWVERVNINTSSYPQLTLRVCQYISPASLSILSVTT
jgi:hypothetical protein